MKRKKIIEYRVYDLPKDFPVILIDGADWHISDIKSSRLHFHNCFEVGICHTDSGFLSFGEEDIPFRAGDITFIPRHIPHTTWSDKGKGSLWSYLFIDFERFAGEFPREKNTSDIEGETYAVYNRAEHERVHFTVDAAVRELREKKDGYADIVTSLLNLLLKDLYYAKVRLRESADESVRKANAGGKFALAPALDYINANYMNDVDTGTLAKLCSFSETHFRREFLRIIGETPHKFLNDARTEHACDLLDTTGLTVLSIANKVGFESVSSFNRAFRAKFGLSPNQWRMRASSDRESSRKSTILEYRGWTKSEVPEEGG